MRNATSASHPTVAELSNGVISLMSGMKLLRHVLDCEECRLEYAKAIRRFSEWYLFDLWREEGLSERVAEALANAGIYGLSELKAAQRGKIPGIGRKGAQEIRELLDSHKEGDSD
ncbi:MAG: helix-hairpin-helix domain-containing protein [Thermoanaerobaculia bacterium]